VTVQIRALSSPSVTLTQGQGWTFAAYVPAEYGEVTGVVILPDGTTEPVTPALVEGVSGEVWFGTYLPVAPGRHLATIGTPYGSLTFVAYVNAVAGAGDMPTLWDLVGDRTPEHPGYLGSTSWSDDDVSGALEAELAAQRRMCRVPAAYSADLREAVLRRVARNLAMRRLPLAVVRGDGEAGESNILPGADPEIRRLERPYRRVPVG
jgi:hypothetical protein